MAYEHHLGDLEDRYLRAEYDRVLRRASGSRMSRDMLQLLVMMVRELHELRRDLHGGPTRGQEAAQERT